MTEVYTQGCRFENQCKRTGDYKEAEDSHCQHNGGLDCPKWRHLTDESLGLYDLLPHRSWSNPNQRRGR